MGVKRDRSGKEGTNSWVRNGTEAGRRRTRGCQTGQKREGGDELVGTKRDRSGEETNSWVSNGTEAGRRARTRGCETGVWQPLRLEEGGGRAHCSVDEVDEYDTAEIRFSTSRSLHKMTNSRQFSLSLSVKT